MTPPIFPFNERDVIIYTCALYIGILLPFVISGWLYTRLSNNVGTLRDSDRGSKWQLSEYLTRQPKNLQLAHKWLNRAKLVSWICFCSIALSGFLIAVYTQTITVYIVTLFIAGCFVASMPIIIGVDALVLKAAIFPRYLWAGKREFATGKKTRFAAYSRIISGLVLLAVWAGSTWSTAQSFFSIN